MKPRLNNATTIVFLLITFFLFSSNGRLFGQEENPHKSTNFKVVIERTDTGIVLKCEKGCAWQNLSFSINSYQEQAIDEFGMIEKNRKTTDQDDDDLTDFLITLIKTDKQIRLKGIEGTAWTELSFSLSKNEKQAVDQSGMTELN